jgi:hypothetical protein
MTLDEYIGREIRLVKEERKPNAISVRFVQLHEQAARTAAEEEEYQMLRRLMHSRWRWFRAAREAAEKKCDDKEQGSA